MDNPNAPLGLSTRWQPGQTGNRGGRPKTIDVRRRSVESAQLVALEGLIDRAFSGDASALAILLAGEALPVPQRASQDAQDGIPGMVAP
jgi:hypothetical protein